MSSNYKPIRIAYFIIFFTVVYIFVFYSYSNQMAYHFIRPYLEEKLQHMDINEIEHFLNAKKIKKEDLKDKVLASQLNKLTKNEGLQSFLSDMMENYKAIRMAMQNRSSKANKNDENIQENVIKYPGILQNLLVNPKVNSLIKGVKNESIKEIKTIEQDPVSIVTTPKPQLYFGKISEVYTPGFRHSPSNICHNEGENLKLLIVVTTSPNHFEHRDAIRKTWGNLAANSEIDLAFIVGSTNAEMNRQVENENYQFKDIIGGKFVDSYYNLTLKTVSLLEWVKEHCSKVKFVLKADDDSFINIRNLVNTINLHLNDTKTMYGHLAENRQPVRNSNEYFYITYEEYPGSKWPSFLRGSSYMMTGDCINPLYEATLTKKYLKLDNVLVTGVVPPKVQIQKVNVDRFTSQKIKDFCKLRDLISCDSVRPEDQISFLISLKNGSLKC